ncbi:MAG TPA: IMP cyclohydrolase [Candidatus Nanoarchaeia archaeon]|nr:IMP cyclohydrolase [Candidatus Nanoarchaeia archaeon]
MSGLEALAEMEYPGRFIVLGLDANNRPVAVYGITGRSPSSQARRLVQREINRPFFPSVNGIIVEPTDKKILAQGDHSLLIYPAMLFGNEMMGKSISVSNGAQTRDVHLASGTQSLLVALHQAHRRWEYEPDAPNYTPRISGKIRMSADFDVCAVLGIIKKAPEGEELVEKHYFEVPLAPGKGRLISTYAGANQNPLPSFRGEPLPVEIRGNSPEQIARDFYDALEGQDGNDFRVSVAVEVIADSGLYVSAIVNRHGNEGSKL